MADKITFDKLPRLVRIKIFGYLQGGSLHRCRQVSKAWNEFIMTQIWNSKSSRKEIMSKIEHNWKPPLNYGIFTAQFDLSEFGDGPIIAATGEHEIVMGFQDNQTLIVINIISGESSRIVTNLPNSKMRVYVNANIVVYLNDSSPIFGLPFNTTIFVVSTTRRELVLHHHLQNLISCNVDYDEKKKLSIILAVTSTELRAYSIDDNGDNIRTYSKSFNTTKFFCSSFVIPYIAIGMYNGDDGDRQMDVFVINDDKGSVQNSNPHFAARSGFRPFPNSRSGLGLHYPQKDLKGPVPNF